MAHSQPKTDFPPVRACIFDLDGLLLNTEDIYSHITNTVLAQHSRPPLPWSLKAQLQGRPFLESSALLNAWAKLPITPEEFSTHVAELQREHFPTAAPLPGVEALLNSLARRTSPRMEMALATSSHTANYRLKTGHVGHLFDDEGGIFRKEQKVMGDDLRIGKGRGKPAPDIFLVALETINERLRREGGVEVKREECLVFEDSVPGVEAGRRAGMRVVWVPHEGLRGEYCGREEEVLAGRAGMGREGLGGEVGELEDGWGELRASLEDFDYGRYGINIVE